MKGWKKISQLNTRRKQRYKIQYLMKKEFKENSVIRSKEGCFISCILV